MDAGFDTSRNIVTFGPFRLNLAERRLERDGMPVQIGGRAFDILAALLEKPGEVVSKQQLIARVWPNIVVEESSLRVHIGSLRRVIDDGTDGNRYIANVPGRGYSFVGVVTPQSLEPRPENIQSGIGPRLPQPRSQIIGREAEIADVSALLAAKRFLTLHGPGGIGKTTVAIAVAHSQRNAFDGDILFLDLGPLVRPDLVASTLATALGLMVQSEDPTRNLIHFLRQRRMLLVLDSCEHVIEAVANLAEGLFQEAPSVSLLTTSREPLRVEGEYVYRLPPLEVPPEGVRLSAAETLTFPAARCFVEYVGTNAPSFTLTDANAPFVAEICRKLDGVALALELAARRAGMHGLHETALLLDSRLRLQWQGRRTALPRHQTLSALLDWSHDLISERERRVLQKLSVLVGAFTLEAAQAIAVHETMDELQVVEALEQLVAKSLVSSHADEPTMRYRLLDTTRAYARAKLIDSGEEAATLRRHAIYCTQYLEHTASRPRSAISGEERDTRLAHLGDVRAALEWCFSETDDNKLLVALAAAASSLFIELSLTAECRRWTERALAALGEDEHGTPQELELQAALGHALMFSRGNTDQVQSALERGLRLAEDLADRPAQFRLLSRMHMYYRRTGEFDRLLPIAHRAEEISRDLTDPVGVAAAHVLLGVSHHLIGNQVDAQTHLEASFRRRPAAGNITASHFAFHRNPQIALARTLWLQGYPDQAVASASQVATEPAFHQDLITYCIALIWGISVFHWVGDWAAAEAKIERLITLAEGHSLAPYQAVGIGLRGEALIARGELDSGMDMLRDSIRDLRAERYELYTSGLTCRLAQGLAAMGRVDQALAMIDDAIARVAAHGSSFDMPELLRLRGDFLAQAADERGAEKCFEQSIALADQQSALSWRLRTATSFAQLRLRQGRPDEVHPLVGKTYARFQEGFDTADLRAAKQFLIQPQ
jgi:predicted ATPase/DNA-binding winged helix-turn-helix (wHTH) protein